METPIFTMTNHSYPMISIWLSHDWKMFPIIIHNFHDWSLLSQSIMNDIPIGSMYAIYGNIYHQYTPVMLPNIWHTWILWVINDWPLLSHDFHWFPRFLQVVFQSLGIRTRVPPAFGASGRVPASPAWPAWRAATSAWERLGTPGKAWESLGKPGKAWESGGWRYRNCPKFEIDLELSKLIRLSVGLVSI